jgi:hypothetical protein
MKKHLFLYSEIKRTVRRTYGGSNYTLRVYEIVNGEVVEVGEVSACTAGHKGESSEAWHLIAEKRPEIIKLLCKRIARKEGKDSHRYTEAKRGSYYSWQFREYGVELKSV